MNGGEAPKLRQGRPQKHGTPFHPVNEVAPQSDESQDLAPEELQDRLLDEGYGDIGEGCPAEFDDLKTEALQEQTRGRRMLNDAKDARGYFTKSEPLANEQQAERDARLQVLTKSAPCRGCGQHGHWSKDAACPKNQGKAANAVAIARMRCCRTRVSAKFGRSSFQGLRESVLPCASVC